MLTPVTLRVHLWTAIVLCAGCMHAQTADRSAAPPGPATAAPAARSGTYVILNGELIVAPGLRIPNGNVPWALDTIDGKQVLVPIHHAAIAQSGPAAGTIDGSGSHTSLRSVSPVFFVHTSDRTENTGDSGRGTPTGWALLAARVDGTTRTVDRVKFSDVNGATVCAAPVLCTQAESLPGGWLRITPREPLNPGEYALLPVPRSTVTSSPLVYDFTINTRSPAPKDAVTPGQDLDGAVTAKKKKR